MVSQVLHTPLNEMAAGSNPSLGVVDQFDDEQQCEDSPLHNRDLIPVESAKTCCAGNDHVQRSYSRSGKQQSRPEATEES